MFEQNTYNVGSKSVMVISFLEKRKKYCDKSLIIKVRLINTNETQSHGVGRQVPIIFWGNTLFHQS